MMPHNISLRVSLWLPIVVMGLVSIALVLMTARRYQDITLDSRRAATAELIQIKSREMLENADKLSLQLASDIQHKIKQLSAENNLNTDTITHTLNQQFHRYFQTAEIIRLRKLYVFDLSYRLIAQSTDVSGISESNRLICDSIINQAKMRTGAARLKVLSGLCRFDGEPLYAVIVPMGSLRPTGYIVILIDPAQYLSGLHKEMGMPLRVIDVPSKRVYESSDWPHSNHMQNTMVATYTLLDQNHRHLIDISLLTDISKLEKNLDFSRNTMMWTAVLFMLLVIAATLLILQYTTLKPLHKLIRTIRVVQDDRSRLGETVQIKGHTEIRQLSEEYNRMTVELAGLYDRLEKLAYSDPLTGLPNRFLFNERVEELIARSKEHNHKIALLMMDLDRFKQINDSLGHAAGDMLLKHVALRLNDSLRARDIVVRINEIHARLGGDEFAAIAEVKKGADDALVIAKRILDEIKKPFYIDNHSLYVGVSIGIAMYPDDGQSLTELMRHADVAMYNAKQNQRGIAFYNSMQDSQSLAILNMESDLRKAIENNMLEVYYQPKVLVETGEVCGAEALLRWHHPEQGWIPPSTFVSIAEQSGLIENLTLWVLEKAVEDCAHWHALGHTHGVAVNLSAKNLRNDTLAETISTILSKSNLSPLAVTLEVTENAVMTDTGRAHEILLELHRNGFVISLDDFGTGHSSLAHLKQLPVSEFKIDKSFVMDMLSNSGDATIVRAAIELGHNLGLKIVAEGVESEAIQQQLQKLHCDYCQGYYFAKPMPLGQWIDFLDAQRNNHDAVSHRG